jgi:GlpG protein
MYTAPQIWDGAYWGLLTTAFLHFEIWHIGFNLYWVWHLGGAIERTLGPIKLLAFVIISAIVSSAAEVMVMGSAGIGASGFGFGLFGFVWAARRRSRTFAVLASPDNVRLWMVWMVGCIVLTQLDMLHIANVAHVAGLASGFLAGTIVANPPRRVAAIIGFMSLIGISLAGCFWNPFSVHWLSHHAYVAQTTGKPAQAIDLYKRAIHFGENKSWALHNLALAQLKVGDMAGYRQTVEDLRIVDPLEADKFGLGNLDDEDSPSTKP